MTFRFVLLSCCRCITLLTIMVALAPAHVAAQPCGVASSVAPGYWSLAIANRKQSHSTASSLSLTRTFGPISLGVSGGQTSAPMFAEAVPEFESSAAASFPLQRHLNLCARVGSFRWYGPSAILLTREHYRSRGWLWSVGPQWTIPLSADLALSPSFSYTRRTTQTRLSYLPAEDWLPPDSIARFAMSHIEIRFGVVVDSIGLLWIAVERPYGMPTSTRFAPLGRSNGENAISIGFGWVLRDGQ